MVTELKNGIHFKQHEYVLVNSDYAYNMLCTFKQAVFLDDLQKRLET